jgi:predicted NAD/FAD-dependent oxidoreductase
VTRTVAVVGGGVAGTASAYALTGRRTPAGGERAAVRDADRGRAAGNPRSDHGSGAPDGGGTGDSRSPWTGGTVEVDLFETAASLGGRIATRERDGCRYDYGANYVKAPDARFQRVIDDALGADRVRVDGRIRVHDGDGTVREGRDEQADRWTGYRGLDALPTGLADASDATVHTGARVESLARRADGWWWPPTAPPTGRSRASPSTTRSGSSDPTTRS